MFFWDTAVVETRRQAVRRMTGRTASPQTI